jgi:hypothetical protein
MYSLRTPEVFFKHGIFNHGINFSNFKYHCGNLLASNLDVCFVQLPIELTPGIFENLQFGITNLIPQEKPLLYKLKITNSLMKLYSKSEIECKVPFQSSPSFILTLVSHKDAGEAREDLSNISDLFRRVAISQSRLIKFILFT